MKKSIFLPLLSVMFFSGCSTVFNGSHDVVNITSQVPKAIISVDGNTIGVGTASFAAKKGEKYTITASKYGCSPAVVTTDTRFEPVTILGAPLIAPMLIDVVNGSAWKVSQKSYVLNPQCK